MLTLSHHVFLIYLGFVLRLAHSHYFVFFVYVSTFVWSIFMRQVRAVEALSIQLSVPKFHPNIAYLCRSFMHMIFGHIAPVIYKRLSRLVYKICLHSCVCFIYWPCIKYEWNLFDSCSNIPNVDRSNACVSMYVWCFCCVWWSCEWWNLTNQQHKQQRNSYLPTSQTTTTNSSQSKSKQTERRRSRRSE